MARAVEHILVPARFFFTICHLVASFMVFYTMEHNILASMPESHTPNQYDEAVKEMNWALAVAMLCFILQLGGLLLGFSMFVNKVNAFYVWIHIVGTATVLLFSIENWRYENYWHIVGFCCVLPAIIELTVMLRSRLV